MAVLIPVTKVAAIRGASVGDYITATAMSLTLADATATLRYWPSSSQPNRLGGFRKYLCGGFPNVSATSTALMAVAGGIMVTVDLTAVLDGWRYTRNRSSNASHHLYRRLHCCRCFGGYSANT